LVVKVEAAEFGTSIINYARKNLVSYQIYSNTILPGLIGWMHQTLSDW